MSAWSSPTTIGEVIPEAAWQRCYVHFLRNALDHLPRKHGDDCLQELRWLYDRRDLTEAKADLAAWLAKWSPRYPRLTSWAEDAIEQTLVNAARIFPKSAEVKFPSFVAQAVAEGGPFFGGLPRGRDGGLSVGGVMAAFDRRCSGISSAC